MRRLLAAALAGAVVMVTGVTAPPALAATSTADGPGALTLVSAHQVDSRLSTLTFTTPALSGRTSVDVLLPSDYRQDPTARYPVLYLLNGSFEDHTVFVTNGIEAMTAGMPVILVMPDGGHGGYYSDWWNYGSGGPPEWETYHIDELVPWIDQHYRTIPDPRERAIGGDSMGGFGAASYAARHPDVFRIVDTLSGAVDTTYGWPAGQADESTFDGGLPYSTWGPYQTDRIIWAAHNPYDLAENLRGALIIMWTGNGLPGGPYPYDPAYGALEFWVHQENLELNRRLDELGISHFFHDYGPGDHSWPYWQRDLQESLPQIMQAFAHPPALPQAITFTAAEPSYQVFGWRVTIARTSMEFSTLRSASSHGFWLSGSGTGTVTTASLFIPGHSYVLTIEQSDGTTTLSHLVADSAGRLVIQVPLGPPNPQREYSPGASTQVYTTRVRIQAG